MVHMKTVCFQDPILIQHYHTDRSSEPHVLLLLLFRFKKSLCRTIAQITYFRSYGLCQGRVHFHEHFLTVFLGWLIIGLDAYIIPHFKANMSWYASVSQQHLFHKRVLCEYRLNGSKVTN